jgi:aldose 1-epimerase
MCSTLARLLRHLEDHLLSSSILTLTNGDSVCTLLPEVGGGLGSWRIGDQNMLRSASESAIAARNPLGLATFPLVPFSNRIGHGVFEWGGEPMALAKNFPPEPHSLHGVGWERTWGVETRSDSAATLTLVHRPDAYWPWPFEARQVVSLEERALILSLSVRNLAALAVPLAFGHHPYFDADGATLTFAAQRVWMTGCDGLPSEPVHPIDQFDFSTSALIARRDIDHCYAGITGAARIVWAGRRFGLEVKSTPQLGAAVVYVPKGGDAFCFEPVPHINNALNLPGHAPAMPVIEAGAQFEVEITFNAVEP